MSRAIGERRDVRRDVARAETPERRARKRRTGSRDRAERSRVRPQDGCPSHGLRSLPLVRQRRDYASLASTRARDRARGRARQRFSRLVRRSERRRVPTTRLFFARRNGSFVPLTTAVGAPYRRRDGVAQRSISKRHARRRIVHARLRGSARGKCVMRENIRSKWLPVVKSQTVQLLLAR